MQPDRALLQSFAIKFDVALGAALAAMGMDHRHHNATHEWLDKPVQTKCQMIDSVRAYREQVIRSSMVGRPGAARDFYRTGGSSSTTTPTRSTDIILYQRTFERSCLVTVPAAGDFHSTMTLLTFRSSDL